MKSIIITILLFPAMLLAKPSDEALKSANELADIMDIKKQFNNGFDALLPAIEQQSIKLNLSPEEKEELKGIYKSWFRDDIDQDLLLGKIVQLYAETFTEKELKGLISFYKTPLGEKTLKSLPAITQKSAMFGIEEGQDKQDLLLQRLKPFFERHKTKIEQDVAPDGE